MPYNCPKCGSPAAGCDTSCDCWSPWTGWKDDSYVSTAVATGQVTFTGVATSVIVGAWAPFGGELMSGGPAVEDHKVYVEKKLYDEGIADVYEVVLPKPNQLLLDYDTPELPEFFEERMNILLQAMDAAVTYQTYESRHGNRHVIVTLTKDLTPEQRIAWQAALGSDPKREALSLLSLAKGGKNPTLLIHRKDGNDRLVNGGGYLEPVGRKFR